jgi:hypothetical protein
MKTICFIGNYKKTFFFDAVAKELKKEGIHICWIVMNQAQFDFLAPTYGKGNLLLLNRKTGSIQSEKIGEYKINELVSVDRALKYYGEWGYQFIENIQKPVYEFVKKNNIQFVFGETTYAHEVMIMRMLKDKTDLNCVYLHPQTIRIPGYHFTFLEDEFQSKIYEQFNSDSYTQGFKIELAKPTESILVEKRVSKSLSLVSKLKRFTRFFSLPNIDKDDPSITPVPALPRFKKAFTEEWNRVIYKFVKTESYQDFEGKKFVIYTLHKQPEASVDVVGRYYDDQYINIQNIWRILPSDWYLVVKEHTNAIGDRSFGFFKKVKKLRHVILANEHINSHRLIGDSEAIFTVSGSIAYEAALSGKPAFMFVPIFFNKHENIHRITLDTLRATNNMFELLEDWQRSKVSKLPIEAFSKYLLSHSAKGLISDPLTDARCMQKENIQDVSNAFIKLILA